MTVGTAEVNGTKLHYEVFGSGPAVILISGGGTLDRRMWDGQIGGSQKTVIPGAGHLLNLDAPDEFNRIVLEFMG